MGSVGSDLLAGSPLTGDSGTHGGGSCLLAGDSGLLVGDSGLPAGGSGLLLLD